MAPGGGHANTCQALEVLTAPGPHSEPRADIPHLQEPTGHQGAGCLGSSACCTRWGLGGPLSHPEGEVTPALIHLPPACLSHPSSRTPPRAHPAPMTPGMLPVPGACLSIPPRLVSSAESPRCFCAKPPSGHGHRSQNGRTQLWSKIRRPGTTDRHGLVWGDTKELAPGSTGGCTPASCPQMSCTTAVPPEELGPPGRQVTQRGRTGRSCTAGVSPPARTRLL